MRGITSVLWRDTFSTVGGLQQYMWGIASYCGGYLQYCGGCSVQWEDNISTVGDSFSTMEGNISTVEGIQYSGGYLQYSGGNISTVEVAQYSGDKDLKYYEFSKNLEIFSTAYFASKSDRLHHRTQLLTTADMVKDLGYKNLVLGKILL